MLLHKKKKMLIEFHDVSNVLYKYREIYND